MADTIQIDPKGAGTVYGKLIIANGGVLTLDNSVGTPENSVVEGTIELRGNGTLFFDANDHTVFGATSPGADEPSKIFGSNDNGSIIQIDSGKKLTIDSNMTVSGRLKIQSDTGSVATFRNEGLVLANGAGTLQLAGNLALEDTNATGGLRWKADGISGTVTGKMLFSKAHSSCPVLQGNFLLTGSGTFEFAVDIYTSGGYTCSGAGTVSGAGTGKYNYNCDTEPPSGTDMTGC